MLNNKVLGILIVTSLPLIFLFLSMDAIRAKYEWGLRVSGYRSLSSLLQQLDALAVYVVIFLSPVVAILLLLAGIRMIKNDTILQKYKFISAKTMGLLLIVSVVLLAVSVAVLYMLGGCFILYGVASPFMGGSGYDTQLCWIAGIFYIIFSVAAFFAVVLGCWSGIRLIKTIK